MAKFFCCAVCFCLFFFFFCCTKESMKRQYRCLPHFFPAVQKVCNAFLDNNTRTFFCYRKKHCCSMTSSSVEKRNLTSVQRSVCSKHHKSNSFIVSASSKHDNVLPFYSNKVSEGVTALVFFQILNTLRKTISS